MITEDDIRAMRIEGTLAEFIARQRAAGHERAAANRAAVLAHPDLAVQLTQPPLDFASPEVWNGYIPPDQLSSGSLNTSPVRPALLALVHEAGLRAGRSYRGAA